MKTNLILLIASTCLLAACSNSSDDKPSAPAGLREDFKKELVSEKKLSDSEKKYITDFLKKHKSTQPSTKIYFDDYDSLGERQRDLNALNEDAKELVNTVKKNCAIVPKKKDESSGPLEEGVVTTKVLTESIDGRNCPIQYSSKERTESQYTKVDLNNREVSSVGKTDTESEERMVDQSIAKKLNFLESKNISSSRIELNNAKYDANGKWIGGHVRSTGTGKNTTRYFDNTITTADLKFEMFGTNESSQMQMLVDLTFPNGTKFKLGVFVNGKNIEAFANGRSYTPEEFAAEFGETINFNSSITKK